LRKFLYRTLLAANILFAISLLLAYLAVQISPAVFTLPAFFGLAYPYLLLFNLIFAITWAVLLKYEALISILVIAAGFNHISDYINIGRKSGSKEGTFKVMSYNLRMFNYFEGQKGNSESKVLSFLKAQEPDIVFLQEFYGTGNATQKDAAIKKALGGKYYSHMKVLGSGKNGYYGIVTYSKFPIIRKGEIIHPASSSLSIFSDIIIKQDTFRIFNNHLQSFRLKRMERSFIEELTDPDDKETLHRVKNISLSLKKGFIRRAQQSEFVKTHINKSPYPVIVAGDFNDTPVSYSYRRIRKGLKDSFVNSGYGAGFTYKGNYPSNRIDYILFDNTLESKYFEILKVRYSDHYPVMAYLKKKD
jgi:endonuclease/exonuclease/phosphatase family metal-dependent hydrolase